MDKFVQKKPKLGDGNLLKIERGDKLKEIAGLLLADYDLKWSERPNEIKLLHPRPGIINESAQVVFTREGRVMKYGLYERKQSDAWKNVGDISRATGVKDAAVCLHDFAEEATTLRSLAFGIKDFNIIAGSQSYVQQFSMPNTGAYTRHLEKCLFFPPPNPRLLPTTRCVAAAVVPSPLRLTRPQHLFCRLVCRSSRQLAPWCARPRRRRRASSPWPRWWRGFPVRTLTPR